uniref:Tetranectin n=1 Tax=Petromyzon marinus TaxID=7757 RepID=A0AAJ7TB41_PETMA|nr:tetranectin [Petromyzon marinus]
MATALLLLLRFLLLAVAAAPPSSMQPFGSTARLHDETVEELRKEIEDIWLELKMLKEQQALQTVCLRGEKVGRKCLLVEEEPGELEKTFYEAGEACVHLGGSLAVPRDADENAAVVRLARRALGPIANVWVGLSDVASEGAFRDQSGVAVNFTIWEDAISGQPDGGRRENCVALSVMLDGRWFDDPCYRLAGYACEFVVP